VDDFAHAVSHEGNHYGITRFSKLTEWEDQEGLLILDRRDMKYRRDEVLLPVFHVPPV
jgi:hypothetical protein